MLAAYRVQDWDGATAALTDARAQAPNLSALWDVYAERIADYRQGAPGPGWDGVYIAKSK